MNAARAPVEMPSELADPREAVGAEPTPTFHFLAPRNQLALGASLGLYMGWVLRNPMLLFVGAVCAAVLMIAWWLAARGVRDVAVRRVHSPRAFEGQVVPVELELTSRTRGRPSMVLVEDEFSPAGLARVRHLLARPLRPHERVTINYLGECVHRRGLYTIGPVRLEGVDPLALFRRRLTLESYSYMVVYPASVDLRMLALHRDGTLFHVGMETSRRPGVSEEFVGLREYRPGDPPGAVHWRSTARHGVPMVREFQEDLTTQVSLFLDCGKMGLTGIGDQTSLEYAIKAASSMARRAIERGFAVQLFAVGADITHVPLGTGGRHLLMVLDALALLKADGESRFDAAVADHVGTLAPGGTLVMIRSATTINLEHVRYLIALARWRRLLPLVVLVDDRAFIKLFHEQESRHVKAASVVELVRQLALEGARVHVVTKASSPLAGLAAGLERGVNGDG